MRVCLKLWLGIVQRSKARLQELCMLLGQVTNEEQLSRVQMNDSVRQRRGYMGAIAKVDESCGELIIKIAAIDRASK